MSRMWMISIIIVVNVAQQNNVNLDSDQINKIVELLKQDCAAGVQL